MLNEYFASVLSGTLYASLATGLCYKGMRGATRFATGVIVICVIMLPLVDIIRGIDADNIFEALELDIDVNASTDDAIEAAFEDGIEKYIEEKYSAPEGLVRVMADGFALDVMKARRIYVVLSGEAALLDYKRIGEDIEENFTEGGECEVRLSFD